MELSRDLMHSVLGSLKGDVQELRKHPRAPLRSKMRILPMTNGSIGQPMEVWTRDISVGGIGISSRSPLPVGSKFIMQLPSSATARFHLLCSVKNCQEVARGNFVIGSTFAELESNGVAPAPEKASGSAPHRSDAPAAELTDEILRISNAILS